ncbi:MAG: tetratricopeptide repeat protein [Gammaproteobacteria bacterium]|nr:MAG: tetratricopeptide repeat protein [Gammaproteobacteria bacterium]
MAVSREGPSFFHCLFTSRERVNSQTSHSSVSCHSPPIRLTIPFLLTMGITPAWAMNSCPQPAGEFVSIESSVEVQSDPAEDWRTASLHDELCEGDTIRVGERSRAAIQLVNDAVLRLDQNTTMRLLNVTEEPKEQSFLDLVQGAFQSFSRKPRLLTVNTPYLNGMIEGTEFVARVEGDRASLLVLEGKVRVANKLGEVAVNPGESAEAGDGQAPQKVVLVKPRDAVQWALYYPPLAKKTASQFKESADNSNNPDFWVFHASELLSAGRADEAVQNLQQALKLAPEHSDALALSAMIAVTQNDRETALSLANKAVNADTHSATALIALSYAQQSQFDLEGALASLQQAVSAEPGNALAWARLAELYSSFARLDEGLAAAHKAAELDPELSRTHTVLGFSHLMQVDTDLAVASFDKAIALDQGDPMPRLGLGLAKIAQGDLQSGRGAIDVAAALDPNQSIIRSYLGKAYYQEKREDIDQQQFDIAKQLDPNDPTPWFYSAIAKQTANDPVTALHELQKAMDLNDNRAVYRSRLLLDSDLASRSASVGRIYSDLGFQELALRAGWQSLNQDPSNFSAHRLLADSYAALPRHEIARVSELLQSQLLQPLNMTPIQPRLSESNLALVSAGGPGSLSFNEFNPVFNRDGIALQTSALTGDKGTSSGEVVLAGIHENVAFSLGSYHYESDGFRSNNDQQVDLGNAFLQVELSPDTSIQAEYRYRKTEKGDLLLRFFDESFYPGERTDEETHTFRLGAKHQFSPSSIVLLSLTHQEYDAALSDDQIPPAEFPLYYLKLTTPDQRSTGAEAQHLYRSEHLDVTSGVGYFDVDAQLDGDYVFQPFPDDFPWFLPGFSDSTDLITRHTNGYSYVNLKPTDTFTATVGLSYDNVNGDFPGKETHQLNPKFGITWQVLPDTTLRLASFRTLKRTLITNQTLEPTQVAGFNQFFDDYNLTEGRRHGIALDQVFSDSLFGGIEYSRRDLDVPYINFDTPERTEWKEYMGRAYLFWTVSEQIALKAEYLYERLKRDEDFPEYVTRSETHKVPLGIHYYHPSGLSSSLTATYVDQQGKYGGIVAPIRSGSDDFWTVDLAVNYRLPKRYGFVSVGATNLFDEEFNYYENDLNNATLQPESMVFAKLTLALP